MRDQYYVIVYRGCCYYFRNLSTFSIKALGQHLGQTPVEVDETPTIHRVFENSYVLAWDQVVRCQSLMADAALNYLVDGDYKTETKVDYLPKIEFNANLKVNSYMVRKIIAEWAKRNYGVNIMLQDINFYHDDADTEVDFDYAQADLSGDNVRENIKFLEQGV